MLFQDSSHFDENDEFHSCVYMCVCVWHPLFVYTEGMVMNHLIFHSYVGGTVSMTCQLHCLYWAVI